jgi:hypothetical protein
MRWSFLEELDLMMRELEKNADPVRAHLAECHRITAPILAQAAEHHRMLAQVWEALAWQQAALRGIVEKAKETVAAWDRVFPYLLDRGWYGTPRLLFPRLATLDKLTKANDHAGIDSLMVALAREDLAPLESDLCQRWPRRSRILTDAFGAHRRGEYTLSTPVFLVQADGIGCEVLGLPRQFFNPKKRSAALKEKVGVDSSLDFFSWGLRAQVERKGSIEEDTDERAARQETDNSFGPLNRHWVLHGHDTDYQSEVNSLRCVVLLRFLLDVDQMLHELPRGQAAQGTEETAFGGSPDAGSPMPSGILGTT